MSGSAGAVGPRRRRPILRMIALAGPLALVWGAVAALALWGQMGRDRLIWDFLLWAVIFSVLILGFEIVNRPRSSG